MELLNHLLPCPSLLQLESWDLDIQNQLLVLKVSSTQSVALCPVCHQPTHRIHSHYERTLRDLPCVNFCLIILLQVCKFFCLNEACQRRIFTERLPEVVMPWARRTARFSQNLNAIGVALGGNAAARLSHQIDYGNSRNTFLKAVSRLPLPPPSSPKIVGVDDFAFRKGHRYGTILVDLEQHRPIALLPDREANTLSAWLKAHPSIEVLTRDRSKTYRAGMNEGAPQAMQIADRFHLLQNLEEVLENTFKGETIALKAIEATELQESGFEHALELCSPQTSASEQSRARRFEKYEQTHALRQQGYLIRDIAHHLGIGERTVYKYLAVSTFPERQPSVRGTPNLLDRYKAFLVQQWQSGQQEAKQLFLSIRAQGYAGSYMTVARFVRQLRPTSPRPDRESLNQLAGRGPAPKLQIVAQPPLTARRAAWLVMKPLNQLSSEEKSRLAHLSDCPQLSDAIHLAQGFINLVRQGLPEEFDSWLSQAQSSTRKAFQSFAKGLKDDYDAVKAGLSSTFSNGQVEGQNNRLKMLKRQMFGRAGITLLEKRLILAS